EPDDESVADEEVVAHALDDSDVLDPRSRAGGRDQGRRQHDPGERGDDGAVNAPENRCESEWRMHSLARRKVTALLCQSRATLRGLGKRKGNAALLRGPAPSPLRPGPV